MTERTIGTETQLKEVLEEIRFNPSCVNLDWEWELKPVFELDELKFKLLGWLIRTSFTRPDTETGVVSRGYGRWELITLGATESTVVKTCWVLAEMIVLHELREAFTYKGVRIFNPHYTVEELSLPQLRRDAEAASDNWGKK